jgi:predicted DNA-binding transcriptional regulator AlpA
MRIIVRRAEGRKRACISRTSEHRLIRNDPTWPRVVQITTQLTGYFEDELDAWIKARPRAPLPAAKKERDMEAVPLKPERKEARGSP